MDGVSDAPLVVVPSAALRSVPWSVLPSCVGLAMTDDAPTIAAAGALVCIGLGHGTAT